MKRLFLFVLGLSFGLIGCNKKSVPVVTGVDSETAVAEATQAPRGMGMGPNSGMSARHHAPIPDEYAELMNPVTADEPSLERGAEIYVERCASCHGDGGMGDGPAAAGLDPGPTAIAHTSQMMGDDYLFYRISEGGSV